MFDENNHIMNKHTPNDQYDKDYINRANYIICFPDITFDWSRYIDFMSVTMCKIFCGVEMAATTGSG